MGGFPWRIRPTPTEDHGRDLFLGKNSDPGDDRTTRVQITDRPRKRDTHTFPTADMTPTEWNPRQNHILKRKTHDGHLEDKKKEKLPETKYTYQFRSMRNYHRIDR